MRITIIMYFFVAVWKRQFKIVYINLMFWVKFGNVVAVYWVETAIIHIGLWVLSTC